MSTEPSKKTFELWKQRRRVASKVAAVLAMVVGIVWLGLYRKLEAPPPAPPVVEGPPAAYHGQAVPAGDEGSQPANGEPRMYGYKAFPQKAHQVSLWISYPGTKILVRPENASITYQYQDLVGHIWTADGSIQPYTTQFERVVATEDIAVTVEPWR